MNRTGSTSVAAIYLRQSLDAKGEGLAVARQEKECRELCKRLGLAVGQVYVDNDVSATSGVERPDFERLLADQPDVIVAWHHDRLLRLTRDLERVINLDVPVHTVAAGSLDLSNPAGRAVARTVAAWSTYETEQKALRQRAAHRQRASSGIPWSTRRPFGFEDDAITQRSDEAEIVRDMYANLLAGVPQAEIARRLNDRGIASTLGNPWRQGSVRALLMNPRNAGLRAHNGEIVGPGAWKPIVPEATWRAAVGAMTRNPARAAGGARKYLLTGLAVCGVCGAKLKTSKSVRGRRHYVCPAFHIGRDADAIDEIVRLAVLNRLVQPDAIDLFTGDRDDLRDLQAEAYSTRQALDTLAEMFAAGDMPASAFRAGTEKANTRLAEIESRMTRAASSDPLLELVQAADLEQAWEGLTLARKRGVVSTLMTVTVNRTVKGSRFRPEDIEIKWRTP